MAINFAVLLDQTLRAAGIPIDGVSIGDVADRSTWAAQYTAAATPAQITQGNGLLLTAPINAAAQAAQDQRDAQARVDALEITLKAIVLALVDQLNVIRAALPSPLGPITPAQALAAIRTKAGTL